MLNAELVVGGADDAVVAAPRRVVFRTRGHTHGPLSRLMSPGDLGRALKPFVFLDHCELGKTPRMNMGLHPHSGIATMTWLFEGSVRFEDTTGEQGVMQAGCIEWFKAAQGAWHGGGTDETAKAARGFQLWLALPPEHELGEVESRYVEPASVPYEGPAAKLAGVNDGSAIEALSPLTYRAVRLGAGQDWRFEPPAGQTLAWCAVSRGRVLTPAPVDAGELAVFEQGAGAIAFRAVSDAEFVVGSAAVHPHDLVMGSYSVHTSAQTLAAGERRIREIGQQLRAQGRI
jgi:redox-sensitive bicupin YhaK (pirin superfamily)